MDFERGMEFLPQKPVNKDSSYSEEEQAKIIEGNLMDIKNQKKRKPLQIVSRQEKIVNAYQKVSDKINELVVAISDLPSGNPRQSEMLLGEIRDLRKTQDELLHMLVLEQKGELTKDMVSKESWSLVE